MSESLFPFIKETARRCNAERVLLLFDVGSPDARRELEAHRRAFMEKTEKTINQESEGQDE
jgi:hypothetical protein